MWTILVQVQTSYTPGPNYHLILLFLIIFYSINSEDERISYKRKSNDTLQINITALTFKRFPISEILEGFLKWTYNDSIGISYTCDLKIVFLIHKIYSIGSLKAAVFFEFSIN